MLIKPQTKAIENMHGETKDFVISRMPATVCREVIAKYPTSALPKIGDYETSEKTMLLIMKYVAVVLPDGSELRLTTKELVNNHVDDVSQLLRLEYAMLEENTGFFGKGGKSGFLDLLLNKVVQSVMPMLTPLLGQLSVPDTPPSETSKPE
ncbi:hypothetical protein B2_38 [Stenotrophomonas phage B2]|nr:hypothetical protein B2_38 [Stenotrophomonas phage B2]